MGQDRRVTIIDVAARAGVHPGTASRALTRPEKVASSTRARVEQAVQDLGFVPNRAARGLITGRTGNVAVIVPDITNPYFAALVRSIERNARSSERQVLLVDTGEQQEEEVRAGRTLAREVDGLIVVSPRRLHRDLDVLGATRAVFVNRPVRGHASVLLRAAPAIDEAVRHLASLGHRRLVYLDGPTTAWAAKERRDAVASAAAATGLEVVEGSVPSPTFDAAVHAVEEVLASRATAVVAFNDQIALGVLAALTTRGVAVPDQVSVVGCDDVPMAAMVAPSLTTIAMPSDEAGALAVEMLDGAPGRRELRGTFVARGSTGPVTPRRASGGGARGRRPSGAARG